ncbi:MAG: hypothetical protein JSU72_07495 [Deltaproteobacteria bacterium]|nr:MAG: hypothetical protein JSU72_07495 [Deltaproteobacteria bacterium]
MAREGDVVLVHVEDRPAFFARIECIGPDLKPDWYQVNLLVLQMPLVQVTWILRQDYISGNSFTMGGKKILIEPVVAPPPEPPSDEESESRKEATKHCPDGGDKGKVIPLFDRK